MVSWCPPSHPSQLGEAWTTTTLASDYHCLVLDLTGPQGLKESATEIEQIFREVIYHDTANSKRELRVMPEGVFAKRPHWLVGRLVTLK